MQFTKPFKDKRPEKTLKKKQSHKTETESEREKERCVMKVWYRLEKWWDFIQINAFFSFFLASFFSLVHALVGSFSHSLPFFFFFNLLFYLSLTKDSERDEKRKLRITKKIKVWICMKKKVKKKKKTEKGKAE